MLDVWLQLETLFCFGMYSSGADGVSDVFVCSVRITTGDRYRIAGSRVGPPRVVGEKLQSGLATVECGGKRAKRNREKGPRSNTLGTPCRKENNRPFTSTVQAVAQSMRMEEHQDPNYQTDHPRKRGWWSCQLCGCSHFHGEEFCGGCGTPKAAAAQEPPSKLLEPLWRDKEEKGRAAETAYRDWRRAESLNIERRSLADRISPARRSEYERRIAECKAKKAAYRRASAVFHDAGRKYKTALSRWQHEWAGNVTNAKKMLGVPTNATEEEIKSAYRRAAKLYHPDRAEGNGLTVEEATRAFRQIQEAYEVLCAVFYRVRS